ncbi:unnamed protein product [Caenorhabditis brenneri]
MILVFLFLVLSLGVDAVFSGVPACTGTQIFNQPANSPYSITYPVANQTYLGETFFPDDFSCEYQINVLPGWFVQVEILLNITRPVGILPPVQVTDHLGKITSISCSDEFYFLSNGGKVRLNTQHGQIHFALGMYWSQYSTEPARQSRVNITDILPYTFPIYKWRPETITADTRVSITIIHNSKLTSLSDLRAVFLYDGPDTNSPCIGTAYDLAVGQTQLVSSGAQMTLQMLFDDEFRSRMVAQDYENTKGIVQFQSLVYMESVEGGGDILNGFDGMGTLDVFLGGVTRDKKNSIAVYNAVPNNPYLPQQFNGFFKTYVLLNGQAKLNISRKPSEFSQTKSFGRKGFLQSTYYMMSHDGQFGSGEINAPIGYSEAKFKVKVGYADMTGQTLMEVAGLRNGTKVFDRVFTNTTFPDLKKPYEFTAEKLYVYFNSNSVNAGMFARFEVNQP